MINVYTLDEVTGQQYCQFEDGSEEWRNEIGELHRLDGPARVWADGSQEWRVDGKLHRDDGQAIVDSKSGIVEWWYEDSVFPSYLYKDIIIRLAMKFCTVPSSAFKKLSFSQIESLVYVFNGWKNNEGR
jgi:hypothetical protein